MKNNDGRSMVEMLGVLAIIGVLSIGGILGYSMAMDKHRLNKTIEAIELIVLETKIMYANIEGYPDLGAYNSLMTENQNTLAAKIMKSIGFNPPYPMGISGYFTVDYPEYSYVTIVVGFLSKASCIGLATKDWGGISPDYNGVSINNETNKYKYSISEASDLCDVDSPVFSLELRETTTIEIPVEENPNTGGGSGADPEDDFDKG